MLSKVKSVQPAAPQNANGWGSIFSPSFKDHCRKAVAGGLYHSGVLWATQGFEGSHEFIATADTRLPRLRRSSGSKFGILCYHRVGTEGVPFCSRLEPTLFEAQMRYLRKRYRLVPLEQLCRELSGGDQVPPTLAITFDDGYRDLYIYALPVLQKYEIPATIYLIGLCMETGNAPWYDRIFASIAVTPDTSLELELNGLRRFSLTTPPHRFAAAWEVVCYLRSISDTARQRWCAEFERRLRPPVELLQDRMLGWEEVRSMQRAGISFGAHTMNHPAVSRLDPSAFQNEFVFSKQLLENGLGVPVDDFAYPFGRPTDGNAAAQEFLVRAGYRSAVTTMEGFNSPGENPYLLRRLQINDDCSLSLFAFNLSRMFFEASAAHPVLWESALPDQEAAVAESVRSIS